MAAPDSPKNGKSQWALSLHRFCIYGVNQLQIKNPKDKLCAGHEDFPLSLSPAQCSIRTMRTAFTLYWMLFKSPRDDSKDGRMWAGSVQILSPFVRDSVAPWTLGSVRGPGPDPTQWMG